MEIPIINRMSEFNPININLLNNHSLISRFISIFDLVRSSLPHRLWKWGALFLALVYTFSSLSYKIKVLILHYHRKSKSLLATASEPLLSHFTDFSSADDDDQNDDVFSSDDEEEKDENNPTSSYDDLTRFNGDFRVKGSFGNFRLPRRRSFVDNFSLSDFVNGNGVVKLWENSILGEIEIPAVAMSPSVVVSAGNGGDGVLGLGLWDMRMNRRSPAVQAQWRSNGVVGIDSGRTWKVYVRDDVTTMVGDVRKLDTPLEDLTEDKLWDADGVKVKHESTIEFAN